jgi:hypothetical protein
MQARGRDLLRRDRAFDFSAQQQAWLQFRSRCAETGSSTS